MDIAMVIALMSIVSVVQSFIILKLVKRMLHNAGIPGADQNKTETSGAQENAKEQTYHLWTPREDAKVPVRSIREMKEYLERHIVKFGSLYVHSFKIDVPNRTVWLRYHDGEALKKVFFGYIEDVAHNIQRWFYEQSITDED